MSSLSGQNASTKSLTGLSDTYSTNIVCDTFEVADEFTIDTGCIVNIPANIIPDPALSTNVALLNRNPQTFTGANTFNTGTTTFNALTVHNATLRNFQSTQAVFPGDFRMLDSTQTYLTQMYQTGTTCVIDAPFASSIIRFSTRDAANTGLINLLMEKKNHIVLQGSASEIDILGNAITINGVTTHTANTTFNANVNLPYPALLNILDTSLTRGLQIQNHNTNPALTLFRGIGNSSRFNFLSNNASGVATTNFYIYNGDTCYLQGSDGLGIGMVGSAISLDGICSFTNTTTPVITQALSLSDNSTKIATTAFIKGQNYALTSDLANYGLLAGANTWTGTTNTFSNASLGNQISIQSTANSGPSTISQVTNSLVISAVTNNTGAYQSTLTLSSRNTTNGGCVLFTGNSTTIVIGQNSTNTNISSTNLTMSSVCSFTNTTTPTITQAIALSDNSTNIATTAFVKGQAYAELTPTANPQIFTGNQQFRNSGANLPVAIRTTTTGVNSSGGLFISDSNVGQYNASVNSGDLVLISTGTGNGTGTLTLTSWSNTPVGLKISPTSSTFLGSVNVPTQLTTDNSTLAASTAYVKNQGYALTTDLTGYALLSPTANPQIFTGQQKFQSTTSNLPISVASTTAGIVGGGGLFVATSATQYNSVVQANDLVLLANGAGLGNANTKLAITTYSNTPVGIHMDVNNMSFDGLIIRQNAPFNCGYSYIASPVTSKTNFDIGYVWNIPASSFTGTAWATSTAVYNILTLPWNGTGDKQLGVWKVDVVIINTCTTAPSSSLCWNTASVSNRTINDTCVGASDLFLFGTTGCQIMRMSFTINVVNLTTTYFLNSLTGGGAGLASNTASSITFTRLA